MEQVPLNGQVSKVLAFSICVKQMRVNRVSTSMLWASMLLVLLFAPSISSIPSGVGDMANEGCLCHGGISDATTVVISGLPEKFESNTTYNLSLEIESSINASKDSHQGGFRFFTKGGGVVQFENASEVQQLNDGWTHELAGTYQRQWNLTWTSPENSTEPVKFSLVGMNETLTGEHTTAPRFFQQTGGQQLPTETLKTPEAKQMRHHWRH